MDQNRRTRSDQDILSLDLGLTRTGRSPDLKARLAWKLFESLTCSSYKLDCTYFGCISFIILTRIQIFQIFVQFFLLKMLSIFLNFFAEFLIFAESMHALTQQNTLGCHTTTSHPMATFDIFCRILPLYVSFEFLASCDDPSA